MNNKEQILKEIKQAVLDVDSGAEVVLFGSRARGDFNAESDWDVLILVDQEEGVKLLKKKIRSALYELELRLGDVIYGLVISKSFWRDRLNESPLYWEVEKDGLVL